MENEKQKMENRKLQIESGKQKTENRKFKKV